MHVAPGMIDAGFQKEWKRDGTEVKATCGVLREKLSQLRWCSLPHRLQPSVSLESVLG